MHVKIVATMTAAIYIKLCQFQWSSILLNPIRILVYLREVITAGNGQAWAGRQTLRCPSTWITSSTCEASLEAFYESAIVVHISCDVEMWLGIQPHDDTCQRFSELDDTSTLLQYIQTWSKWTNSTDTTFQEQNTKKKSLKVFSQFITPQETSPIARKSHNISTFLQPGLTLNLWVYTKVSMRAFVKHESCVDALY